MKRILLTALALLILTFTLVSCDFLPTKAPNESDIPKVEISEDGYVIVNGEKTEHKVQTEDDTTKEEDKISVSDDGYLVVNGVKTEYKIHTEPIVSVIDGYVAVNGVKTEYKVDTEDVFAVDTDGYLIVNGIKTDYKVILTGCNHVWENNTIAPTCKMGGYDIMTCKICDKFVKFNETAKLEHSYSTSYSFDNDHHWFACTVCGDKKDKTNHTLDDAGICTVCKDFVSSTPGITYKISYDKTYAEVTGYTGTDNKVKIASKYEGLPVTIIGAGSFQNKTITDIIIPDSVTSIENSAFSGCSALTDVTIPDFVTNIEESAFSGCSGLINITLGNSVDYIGNYAFYGCSAITGVTIPDSVTYIDNCSFENCYSLTELSLGNSISYIGNSAFSDCSSLKKVVIPNSVHRIGDAAFYDCTDLVSVIIGNSVTRIGSSAFSGCTTLTSITIPKSVTCISDFAFYRCCNLTSIILENPENWSFYSSDPIDLSVTPIPKSKLSDPENAAKYLTSYNWGSLERDET